MWGVLLVPSSSPTLSPIFNGLDVNVTSNVTWFHLNHIMVSRRIYKLSFYGGHTITRDQSKTPEPMRGTLPNNDQPRIPHSEHHHRSCFRLEYIYIYFSSADISCFGGMQHAFICDSGNSRDTHCCVFSIISPQ